MRKISLSVFTAGFIGVTCLAQAASSSDPSWPCVQRKVPELSAVQMWGGPEIPANAAGLLAEDDAAQALIAAVALRRTSLDEAAQRIEAYASSLDAAGRNEQLTAVFAALLARTNKERQDIIRGIERFTLKQRALVRSIQQTRIDLEEALAAKDRERRRNLEQKLIWQSRIHEDREKSLIFVCESPQLLEQRIFALAREIQNHLVYE